MLCNVSVCSGFAMPVFCSLSPTCRGKDPLLGASLSSRPDTGGGDLVAEETCLEKFSTPNSGAIFPITLLIVAEFFPYFILDIKFKICTLCWGGVIICVCRCRAGAICFLRTARQQCFKENVGGKKYPKGMAKRQRARPEDSKLGSYDQGQRLGAISNLDATCSAGNCVDLSKLDPHHTFSPSGVPLSKESRP